MRPARQGDFDGLCGAYAIMNTLDLAGFAEPRSKLHQQLFTELALGLGAAALLDAMHVGLCSTDLIRASALAFRLLDRERGIRLSARLPFGPSSYRSLQPFLRGVAALSAKPQHAIVLNVRINGYRHWTVAKAVSGFDIQLRDSRGRKSLDVRRFRVEVGPNCFFPADTLLIAPAAGGASWDG